MLIKIDNNNIDLLQDFLKKAGNSLITFRYFNKRDLNAISNHVVTYIILEDNEPVAYGHLDKENEIIWLGICVTERYRGRGYGDKMMDHLLSYADSAEIKIINLSVDRDNCGARKLYEKKGFMFCYDKNNLSYYKRETKMADTLGGLIDKLFTIDMKMWDNQELLYELRRMNFEEFKSKYLSNEDGAKRLWECLKKACDLNVQRNQLIDEVDEKIVEIIKDGLQGNDLDAGKYIQRKHKTY